LNGLEAIIMERVEYLYLLSHQAERVGMIH